MREVLEERGKMILEDFTEQCRKRGIKSQTLLDMGLIANEICERSKVADLVVIGHRGINEEFSTGLLGTTAESITRKCPRPVFVSTKKFKAIERPLLAYDGSQRASSAMESAAEFCTVFGLPLHVLSIAKEEQIARNVSQQAKSYLSSYAVDVRYEIDRGYPEQKIIDNLTKFDYDLLFIGAYGHRRIIEMVIGSTTEYVLRNSPCPVFLNR
jgi:nucleotide-binding universal stress UspA family protein